MAKLDYKCCDGCIRPKRHPGCQGTKCQEWAEYNKRIELEKEKIRKEKDKENIYIDAKCRGVERYRRRVNEKI